MLNYDKVVARRFITHVADRLHRRSVGINVFENVNLKARKHKTKSICVKFIVRYHSHQQMNTNFRRFKTLTLRNMAGDKLKDYVDDATSLVYRILMTFFMCVGLYDGNQHCVQCSILGL